MTSPDGPGCPVGPELDDRYTDVLVASARATQTAQQLGPQRPWQVRITPADGAFGRWLLWTNNLGPGAAFTVQDGAVVWPMQVCDATPAAEELERWLPGEITARAEQLGS